MTVFEYAIVKFTARVMTPAELARGIALAEKAEDGDAQAWQEFKQLVSAVLADSHRRQEQHRQSAKKK